MSAEDDPVELARAARLAQAADARSARARWDRLGAEEATVATTLERLAARGRPVRLGGAGGHHQGWVVELGPDHVRLDDRGRRRYLRLGAVETVEAIEAVEGDGAEEAGPARRVERTWAEQLSRLVGPDGPVTVLLASGARHTAPLVAVGIDVLILRRVGPAGPLYVSSSSVVAVLAGVGSG